MESKHMEYDYRGLHQTNFFCNSLIHHQNLETNSKLEKVICKYVIKEFSLNA